MIYGAFVASSFGGAGRRAVVSDVGSRRWIRSAAVAAENSSVGGAASTVVESSLSRTILGISEGCGGRTIVGAADVGGSGEVGFGGSEVVTVRASRRRTK